MENKDRSFIRLLLMVGGLLLITTMHSVRAQQQQPSGESTQGAAASRATQIIYVTGAVRSPARLEFSRSVRLTEALCCVGGLLPESKNKVRIYRGGVDRKYSTVISVDLKAIKKRSAEDIILQPYDIVEVVSKNRHGGHLLRIIDVSSDAAPTKLIELPLRKVKKIAAQDF